MEAVDLDKLEKLAKAATPGKRWAKMKGSKHALIAHADPPNGPTEELARFESQNDALFYAALNPATVLELIAYVREEKRLHAATQKANKGLCDWVMELEAKLKLAEEALQTIVNFGEFTKDHWVKISPRMLDEAREALKKLRGMDA